MNNNRNNSEKVGEHVRIFQRGSTWHATYQFGGKQCRQSLKTSNKKTAIRNALELDRRLTAGERPVAPESATITEAIVAYTDYLIAEGRAKKTIGKYSQVFTVVKSIAQAMARTSILDVNFAVIDKFRAERSKTCGAITIYHETVIVRQLIKFAVTRRLATRDPLLGLRLKKPKPTPQPYFDETQIQQILSAARPPHTDTFLLLAETGLRIGEAQWLSWNDVDLKANVIHVRAKDNWRPKTGDERAVPLSPKLRVFLEVRRHHGRWVLTAMPTNLYPSLDRQIDPRRSLGALKRVLTRLGMEGKLHSIRHSFISCCLTKGIEESVVRAWVGHADPTIMRLYTHISSPISQDRIKRLGATDSGGEPRGDDSPTSAFEEIRFDSSEFWVQHISSTKQEVRIMAELQRKSRRQVMATASWKSGEGGI